MRIHGAGEATVSVAGFPGTESEGEEAERDRKAQCYQPDTVTNHPGAGPEQDKSGRNREIPPGEEARAESLGHPSVYPMLLFTLDAFDYLRKATIPVILWSSFR